MKAPAPCHGCGARPVARFRTYRGIPLCTACALDTLEAILAGLDDRQMEDVRWITRGAGRRMGSR